MSQEEAAPVNPNDLKDLKERMKLIVEADPKQYHNEFALKRYLRAFKKTDEAFQASFLFYIMINIVLLTSVSFARLYLKPTNGANNMALKIW